MGAQQLALAVGAGRKEEGVVHLPCGVPLGEIELGKIIIVALYVRPLGHRKAQIRENGREFVGHLRHGMNAAALQTARKRRQRHVEPLRRKPRRKRFLLQNGAARSDGVQRLVLQGVNFRAFGFPLLGRHLAERREQRRNRPLLAERSEAHGFERRLVGRGFDRR
jgi:hypothetical protein